MLNSSAAARQYSCRYSRLVTTDTTTPVSADLLGFVEVVGLGSRDEVGKSLLVLGADVVNGDNGRGLLAWTLERH